LNIQSASTISIISSLQFRTKDFLLVDTSATHYHFDTFVEEDLEAYLDSGLWRGKAGGCMVEGFCKKYIKSVDGFESTAMGLQVEVLLPWINGMNTFVKKGII
jgi:septum formation protein